MNFSEAIVGVSSGETAAIKEHLDSNGYWTEEFIAGAIDAAKKAYIRNSMRSPVGPDGTPLFVNLVSINPWTGERTHYYKLELDCDRDDYMQVVAYHRDRAEYHDFTADHYAYNQRYRFPDPEQTYAAAD